MPSRTPTPPHPTGPTDQRDAPAGRSAGKPSAPLRQAYRDILRGVQDTSRSIEADRSYKKLKR
jgi:hypothetical protein